MTFQQLLRILRAHSPLIFVVTALVVLSALAVSLALPKKYTADAAVVVDVKSPDPVAGTVLPGLISPGYMATQVDIVNSDRVAQRVVKRLRLEDDANLRQQWQEVTGGTGSQGDFVAWLGNVLQKNLEVKPSRESSVINISFGGVDPAFVADVANAFAAAYIDIDLELKVQPARQNATWFDEQTRLARERLEAAQAVYSSAQKDAGIVASGDRLDIETARLDALSAQLSAAQGETSDSRSKNVSIGNANNLPDVIENPLIISLKTDIARLESKLQESNVNLGRNHPQTQRAESELASLRSRLNTETQKIVSGIATTYRIAQQKETDLRASIEAQKKRVLGLSQQNDAISVLKRDVDSAQKSFDDVSQRAAQTRLQSLSVLTNVAILNPASVPTTVSSPKTVLNLVLALFLGLLLGTGVALIKELANRRIRSASDLVEALSLPFLAAIPHAAPATGGRRGRSLRQLFLPGPARAGQQMATHSARSAYSNNSALRHPSGVRP